MKKNQPTLTNGWYNKIRNSVVVWFGPRVHTHSVDVNAYFGKIIPNSPLTTTNYGQVLQIIMCTITVKVTAFQITMTINKPHFSALDSVNDTKM